MSRQTPFLAKALKPLALAVIGAFSGAVVAVAQVNVSCAGSPTANCADVPAAGISYTSGVDTVNVSDGVAGATNVNPGKIGIELSRSGVSGAPAPDADFSTIKWDTDGNPDTPLVDVVSKDGTTPQQVDGNFILVLDYDAEQKPKTFRIGAQTYTGLELAQFLVANSSEPGTAITGSLTVNNSAPLSTTNAPGIAARSTGGNGGGGSCYTIIFLYSWCDDGSRGGDAGSVAVNSNAKITVNGDSPGITAVSQGGTGGNGGGLFGLGSNPGGGGNGGNGGAVFVTLGKDSDITTYGAKSYGVFAQSRGGDGGSGGHASGVIAIGDDGGNGGDAGNVVVENQGAILTKGWNAHGILARSVGAGAGSGSGSGGLYAEGGNGGGESSGAAVTVNNSGSVTTEKSDAFGILAQSIGGGGGDGGGAGGWFTVGGRAGSGGGSGVVRVFDSGTVHTGGDRSTAIFAQSVGGGGGNGGDAVSIGQVVSVAVGGSGGLGGAGNEVHVITEGSDIETVGDSAHGIHAQSIGGGGGNGGLAVSGTRPGSTGFNISVALGGNGGGGGNAGTLVDVQARSGTAIDTVGAASYGILAQSIGGGGGNGGMAFAGSGGPGLSVAVAIGGKGGVAGDGKDVNVQSWATIATKGDLSAGIFTQSIGGGGGNGGFAGSLALGGTSASVSVGGAGATGGQAGRIEVDNFGTIDTGGASAAGIVAQSIGGGGGNGGSAFAGSIGLASVSTSVGGGGGAGNDGGVVDILNKGVITTRGNNSAGVFAQSIGGGGGSGGDATSLALAGPVAVAVGVGGSGGTGGDGGNVTVANEGRIEAHGPNSDGVFAQSIGGGGGSGGSATTGTLVFPVEIEGVEIPAISANVSVGGRGGGGGIAGEVHVTNSGEIATTGFLSNGVFAQSVGGSGGKGGHATNISIAFDATFTGKVAVGGSGGQGGVGSTVTVENSGLIATAGNFANGVFAQSVGGGGGAGGNSTNVSLSLSPPPTAPEDFIPTPSANFDLAFGGNGGNGAIGGQVGVTNYGKIETMGNFASGVMAQSVGGAGGFGGDARTIQVELTANPMDFAPLTALTSLDLTLVVGGTGGSGSNGGVVNVTNKGDVTTAGAFSHGIVAQSVGGGGGAGGSAMTFQFSNADVVPEVPVLSDIAGLTTLNMTLQGSGGAGGNGGLVTVDSTGDIKTSGHFAMGIVAQSVAGGGGLAGFYNPHGITGNEIADAIFNTFVQTDAGLSFAGSVGGAGNAGDVNVNHAGNIVTLGDGAHGIFAQSAAGQGTAGKIGIQLDGSISASGKDAYGIYAQSGGAQGNGDITVEIKQGGAVQGGSGMGAGVRLVGGANNSLTNHGTISALSGTAILAGNNDDTIHNFGTVNGSVDLGSGANSFHNKPGATFNSGATVNLGAANALTNDGTLSPGGAATVLTSSLTGRLQQSASGTYLVSLDLATDTADKISVTGPANLAGSVAVQKLNTGQMTPGKHQVTIVSSSGGVTSSNLSLATPASAVIRYELVPTATDVALTYGINFAPSGLNANQAEIGRALNNAGLGGGSGQLAPLLAGVADQPDARRLADAYDRLSPETYLRTGTATVFSNMKFSDAMHSCAVNQGTDRFIREGECGWLRFTDGLLKREATDSNLGFDRKSIGLSGAVQRALGDGTWHLGGGFAYEQSTLDVEEHAHTTGDQIQLGAIVKKGFGATLLSVDLNLGYGTYSTSRFVNLPTPGVTAQSNQEVMFFAGHVRLAHAIEQRSNWYLKPMIDFGLMHARFPGFDETGAGAANLSVQSHSEGYANLTPAIEIGGEMKTASGALLRPYTKLGLTYFLSGTTPEITASFQGAPVGAAPFTFTVKNEIDKTYENLEIGLSVLNTKGLVVQAAYSGSFSEHINSNSGVLKVSIPY